jgi:hypothetical protein
MSKKILAIYYSQPDSLGNIIDNFTAPLIERWVSVEKVIIHPKQHIHFPGQGRVFFQ